MSNLRHGVHITPPQPIEEAIAWHTVPAQLSALRKQLRDAETSRQAVAVASMERLEELERATKEWFEVLRLELRRGVVALSDQLERTAKAHFQSLQRQMDSLGTAQQSLFFDINEHLDRLDEAQEVRLEKAMIAERKLTARGFEDVQLGLMGVSSTIDALSGRIHQLEQAPLKRFWRWLTRKGRKNGPTI